MVASPDIETSADDVIEEILDALRVADAAAAKAACLLSSVVSSGSIALRRGLPAEVLVRLAARRVRSDTTRLFGVAELLRLLPATAALITSGVVSYSQASAVAAMISGLDPSGRARVDALIGRRAPRLASAEPERLVFEVGDLVARVRDDLMQRREQRAIERNFLALQPRFEGGGTLYGEADAEGFATLAEALDAAAEAPEADDPQDEDSSARGRQRMEALVGICGSWLAAGSGGGSGGGAASRPRPRFLVSFDLADQLGINEAARILQHLAGEPVRLSRLATQTMLCDAQLQFIVFKDGQPIGISDPSSTIPAKLRAAVIARDGGCRFPGCGAPAGWGDVHHIIPRRKGGSNTIENLILLCRRCHRRIHLRGWRLRFLSDGTAEFRHRGRLYTSHPRARAPARE